MDFITWMERINSDFYIRVSFCLLEQNLITSHLNKCIEFIIKGCKNALDLKKLMISKRPSFQPTEEKLLAYLTSFLVKSYTCWLTSNNSRLFLVFLFLFLFFLQRAFA